MKLEISDDQMEVFAATAEKAGFADRLLDVMDHGADMDPEIRLAKAQGVVEFTRIIVCEGISDIQRTPVIGIVTIGLIDMRFDQDDIDEVLGGYLELSRSDGFRSVMTDHRLDEHLTPLVFTMDHLIAPSSHQIIHLRQLASEAPELSGLEPVERWQRLLKMHPASQI